MCKLIDLSGQGECRDDDGGIYLTLINNADNIASYVFAPLTGVITSIVMTTPSTWKAYEYDTDDDTPYYNQNQVDNSKTVTQEAFFKFAGVTNTMVEFADGIKSCCRLVAIHFFNSGLTAVQGVDVDLVKAEARKSFKPVKARVNILSGTSAEQSKVEVFLTSTAKYFSKPTSLTKAAILAL